MENIRLIDEKIGIRNLPDKLRIIAEMRMQNPYVTLKELAEMTDPPCEQERSQSPAGPHRRTGGPPERGVGKKL